MTSGRIVVIAAIVSALTSAGVFFGLRTVVGMRSKGGGAASSSAGASSAGSKTASGGGGAAKSTPKATSTASSASSATTKGAATKRTVNVPAVAGKKLSVALQVLMGRGLRVDKVKREQNDGVAADSVIRTSPPAGTPLMSGSKVNVFVSSGGGQVEVPRVTGLREAGARRVLTKAGFQVRSRSKYDEDKMEGVIIGQRPRAKEKAKPGSTVTIIVNRE